MLKFKTEEDMIDWISSTMSKENKRKVIQTILLNKKHEDREFYTD